MAVRMAMMIAMMMNSGGGDGDDEYERWHKIANNE